MELFVPYFRLLDAGARVDIAAPTMDDIGGENGYTITPDLLIDEVDPDEYDLLIVPGGFPDGAPFTVRSIAKAQEIARSFFADNKPVASICHGPWLLVSPTSCGVGISPPLARRRARGDPCGRRPLGRQPCRRRRQSRHLALAAGPRRIHLRDIEARQRAPRWLAAAALSDRRLRRRHRHRPGLRSPHRVLDGEKPDQDQFRRLLCRYRGACRSARRAGCFASSRE